MLHLTGISKNYGDQQGVIEVDLVAPAGSRTVIVGPSGSGKTTLLRLIAGFETPDAGTIALNGRTLDTVPPHQRNIAYVAQEGALFPHMSIADNVGFAIPRGAADRLARIDELLASVGLPPGLNTRRPHELSGGQQQRVALARALAQKPALMLLDEPFSALDTGLRETMRDLVETVLTEAGIASVLVTHDQSEALAFADHLVVMRRGRVADAGPPQRLYDRPIDPDTAQFLGEAIILPAEIGDGVAHTALGPVPVAHTHDASALVVIRPEQLQVRSSPGGDGTAIRGTVVKRSYQGGFWRLKIVCPGVDRPLFVQVPAQNHISPDGDVYVSVRGTGHVMV